MIDAQSSSSTRPYLIRALYAWCTDNGLTPYVAVQADDTVQVPREHIKDGEIVLNISFDATSALELGNEFISFSARFAGKPREIIIPIERVIAIYARENGQGMAFPRPAALAVTPVPLEAPKKGVLSPRAEAPRHSDVEVKLVESVPPPKALPSSDGPPEPKRPGPAKRPKLTRIK